MKWLRKAKRFLEKNKTMIEGIVFIMLFFGTPIIAGLIK